MWLFRTGSCRQLSAGATLLRVFTGLVFMAHGAQKLFVMGMPAVQGGCAQTGVPLPALMAPMITFLELGGGTPLVIGLLTRVWAALLVCDMIGAIAIVHWKA